MQCQLFPQNERRPQAALRRGLLRSALQPLFLCFCSCFCGSQQGCPNQTLSIVPVVLSQSSVYPMLPLSQKCNQGHNIFGCLRLDEANTLRQPLVCPLCARACVCSGLAIPTHTPNQECPSPLVLRSAICNLQRGQSGNWPLVVCTGLSEGMNASDWPFGVQTSALPCG